MSASLSVRSHGRATILTLNRPRFGNALNVELVEALHASLDALPSNCETLVLRGNGKGFCGGLDLSGLAEESDATLLWRLVRIEQLLQRLAYLPQYTVAMAHGFAFGAGADLVVACRNRIAAPDTRFSFPGVRFGVTLGTGRLSQTVGPDNAYRLLAATLPLAMTEALACGLVNQSLDPDSWSDVEARFATQKSSLDPVMAVAASTLLTPQEGDRDLAALVKSAAAPGLKDRLESYVERIRAERS